MNTNKYIYSKINFKIEFWQYFLQDYINQFKLCSKRFKTIKDVKKQLFPDKYNNSNKRPRIQSFIFAFEFK